MNLSVKRIALLFSVASAILTTACDETKEIGLPQGQPLGVSVIDVPTNTATVLVDSVITSNGTYLLAGRYNNPKLGFVSATSYFQPTYTTEFTAENPTRADSAVLFMPYSYFYGDTTKPYTISVHLLQDSIRTKRYYSSEQIPYEPSPAAQATFLPRPNSADTLRFVRLKLPAAVADRLLTFANKPVAEFEQNFTGFAVVGTNENNNAMLGFQTQGAPLLRLYYQTTTAQIFNFGSTESRSALRFNHISGDRSGTVLEGLNGQYSSVSSTAAGGETYVQGGTGIMTRIEFPDLTSLPQLANAAINKAELVVTPLPGTVLSTRSRLILYDATGEGRILRNPNNDDALQFIAGEIPIQAQAQIPPLVGYTNNAFTFNVTRYVADVLLKRRGNNGLFLSLPSAYDRLLRGSGTSAETSLEESISTLSLGGHNNPTAPVKLRIYYTPIRAN